MDIRTSLTILESIVEPKPNLLVELTGYKSNPVIPAFKDAMSDVGTGYMPRAKRKGKLMNFLMEIEEHGFVAVNYGSFGAVFSHPATDYVIKLFKHDQPYLDFINYVQANQGNPHLPVLRGKMMNLGDGIFGLRIERLKQAPRTKVRERLFDALDKVLATGACHSAEDFAGLVDYCYPKPEDRYINMGAKAYIDEQPGLFDTLYDLVARSGEHDLDFHQGNFMVRGSTIVIIDPFADMKLLEPNLDLLRQIENIDNTE